MMMTAAMRRRDESLDQQSSLVWIPNFALTWKLEVDLHDDDGNNKSEKNFTL